MTIPRNCTPVGMIWISIVSAVLGVVLALVAVGVFSGRLEARVTSLEGVVAQSVPRGEWGQFERDVRARLDRIENKLDQHMQDGKQRR